MDGNIALTFQTFKVDFSHRKLRGKCTSDLNEFFDPVVLDHKCTSHLVPGWPTLSVFSVIGIWHVMLDSGTCYANLLFSFFFF